MGLDFLRQAMWLDAARVRGYLLLIAVANVAVLPFLVATSNQGVDRNGFLLGTDFLSFWTSGPMVLVGANVYDTAEHIAAPRAAPFIVPAFARPLGMEAGIPITPFVLADLFIAVLRHARDPRPPPRSPGDRPDRLIPTPSLG
jgi:hypothetical protein